MSDRSRCWRSWSSGGPLALTLAFVLSACVASIHPPKAEDLDAFARLPPLTGRVQLIDLGEARLPVKGGAYGRRLDSPTYYADVGVWSSRFAHTLRREFARRGVDTASGPTLAVELTHINVDKRAFYRIHCTLRVRVAMGGTDKAFVTKQGTGMNNKRGCVEEAYVDLVNQILVDPDVVAVIRAGATP